MFGWWKKKKTQTPEVLLKPRNGILAMVALQDGTLPDEHILFEQFRAYWPDDLPIFEVERQEDILFFRFESERAMVARMPFPMPWNEVEAACRSAWYWPEAEEAMKKHTSHLVISLTNVVNVVEDATERMTLLSRLVDAAAAVTNAVGIYWGAGGLVHEPAHFGRRIGQIGPKDWPVDLWVGIRMERQKDGLVAYTTGLQPFGLMEVEVGKTSIEPSELYAKVYDICHYLLVNGPVLLDGQTIGHSEEERIRIHHRPSMWDKSMQVVHLEIGG